MEDRWTDRLSEYLDGELDATERAELERHAAGCAACAATLVELRTVVARVANLPETGPSHDLWPGIAARLDAARAPIALDEGVISLAAHRRRLSFTLPQLAAAGIGVIALSSGLAWWVANGGGRSHASERVAVTPAGQTRPAAPVTTAPASASTPVAPSAAQSGAPAGGASLASATPTGSAEPQAGARRTHLVSAPLTRRARAERDYQHAVGQLETVLRQERSHLRPETVAALQKSLADIDQALADARRALARDPGNVYLNAHLAETMQLKLEVLRAAASLTQS